MTRNLSWAVLAVLAVVTFAGCDSARKVPVVSGAASTCSRCHGYPPSAATGDQNHPNNSNCSVCHPGTVESDQVTLIPGGDHANGKIDVFQHPADFALPANHGQAALASFAHAQGALDCTTCHGSDLRGGGTGVDCNACHSAPRQGAGPWRFQNGVADWAQNCTFCHGEPKASFDYQADLLLAAPPTAVSQDPADPAIGAHGAHLYAGGLSPSYACGNCHVVPAATYPASLAHLADPQVVKFGDLANVRGVTSSWDDAQATCTTACHGKGLTTDAATGVAFSAGVSPGWDTQRQLRCNSCHGLVPSSGLHVFHVVDRGVACGTCHKGYAQASNVDGALHANGTVDVVTQDGFRITAPERNVATWNGQWDQAECTACHDHLSLPVP